MKAIALSSSDSSVEEVLSALATAFNLRYRASTVLDRPLTGVYQGTLQRVLTRILGGYDFIIKNSSGSIEVVVRGVHNRASVAPAVTAANSSRATTTGPESSRPPSMPVQNSVPPQAPPASEAQLELLPRSLQGLRR
jgi:hypothetical protein